MNVKNCRKCGVLFNYIAGVQLCPQCRAAQEAKFQEVKKYVYANRSATMKQISDDCNVSISQIQVWVREERLVFTEDSPISIGCEKCGTMIKTGKYCAACKAEMTNTLRGVMPKNEAPAAKNSTLSASDSAKMRYL